ncbi:HAD-like domain-containing protein [Hyaloraphidium curvatum]|nr:HAD-like domain-containing protein [Hyaloraphidium curvatum]
MSAERVRYHPVRTPPESAAHRTIRGVLFDMDNTLVTSTLDFKAMRQRLGILPTQDIIATMRSFPPEKRAEAERIVAEMEADAIAHMEVYPGAHELLQYLADVGLPMTIITRNNEAPLSHAVRTHFSAYPLRPLIHRDSPFLPKPHPDGFLHAASAWDVDPRDCMIVGDHGDDLRCGRDGGGVAVLVRREGNAAFEGVADRVVDRLDEIIGMLEGGFEVLR